MSPRIHCHYIKPDAIVMTDVVKDEKDIQVLSLLNQVSTGCGKQLIYTVTGRQAFGGLPADIGVEVNNDVLQRL